MIFYKKQGIPEEGEFVICTVKKIFPHSVFVDLDEYENREAMIHISEISPGRIRSIRDFVKEGRKLVCKVLRINQEKGQVDLSLRRVSLSAKKQKNEEYKQEKRAEKILETISVKTKTSAEEMNKEFVKKIIEEHGSINNFFQEYSMGNISLEASKIPQKYHKYLEEAVKDKAKPSKVKIESVISLTSEAPDGIEVVKKVLKEAEKKAKEKEQELEITYISAPKYRMVLTTQDYKTGEITMQQINENILKHIKKEGGYGETIDK